MLTGPLPPVSPLAIVSRYDAFPALVKRLHLAGEDVPVLKNPHPEEVRGFHILTDSIGLELAAFAAVVTIIPLHLPEDVDTAKAALDLLVTFSGKPKTYAVRGSSMLTLDQHKGGTSPVASLMAQTLIKEFNLDWLDEIEVADRIDSLLYDERRAGSETERMLLRMLTAAHDRHRALELQLISRGGNVTSGAIPAPSIAGKPATP